MRRKTRCSCRHPHEHAQRARIESAAALRKKGIESPLPATDTSGCRQTRAYHKSRDLRACACSSWQALRKVLLSTEDTCIRRSSAPPNGFLEEGFSDIFDVKSRILTNFVESWRKENTFFVLICDKSKTKEVFLYGKKNSGRQRICFL